MIDCSEKYKPLVGVWISEFACNNITLYRPWSWKTNLAEMVHEEKGWTWCSSENSSLLQMWLRSNLWPSIVEVEFPVGLSSCSFLPWVMFSSFPPIKPTTSKFQTGQKTVDLYQQMDLCLLTPFCQYVCIFVFFWEKKLTCFWLMNLVLL